MMRAVILGLLTTLTLACDQPLAELDRMSATVLVGKEYSNWTPTETGGLFDLGQGFQVKEAVGVQIDVNPAWSDDPATEEVESVRLSGILSVRSSDEQTAQVFAAPNGTFALLARKPGAVTLELELAGHPGVFQSPVTVVAADSFVKVEIEEPEDEAPAPAEPDEPAPPEDQVGDAPDDSALGADDDQGDES